MSRVQKMMRSEWMRKNLGMALFTIVMVGILFFFSSMIAKSKTDLDRVEQENHYQPLEQQLVQDARDYLEELGFKNSGVMLTRVIDEEGNREYKLTVHHAKLDRMTGEERELVAEGFSQFYFEDDVCTFQYRFMLNN